MPAISHSERLRRKIELLLPDLVAASNALADHPRARELYPEYLVGAYQAVRATEPLIRTALGRCRELADSDPVAAGLIDYLEHQAEEESGHDEWALDDLEAVGVPRAEAVRRPASATLAALVGSQYYWVLHHHPVALLGHVAVREGYAPGPEAVELLTARTGYPRAAFRLVGSHSELDVGHREELFDALDALPLGEEHHALIGLSALQTVDLSTQLLRELLDRAAQPAPALAVR